MKITVLYAFFIGLLTLPLSSYGQNERVNLSVSQESDALHFEFSGRDQWDYEIEKKGTAIEIEISGLKDSDLKKLKESKFDLVSKIVTRPGADGKTVIRLETASGDVESFDYLTDQPSRLIVDIFKRELPQKSLAQAPKTKSTSTSKNASRDPASDALAISSTGGVNASSSKKWILDASDPELKRFDIQDFEVSESAIIASKDNFYPPLKIMRAPSPFFEEMLNKQPSYEISRNDSEENKQARLILTLSQRGRVQVTLQTIEWFLKKFPNSKYDEIIRFIKADNEYKIWQESKDIAYFDRALTSYQIAAERHPTSPLAERSALFSGLALLDRGDWIKSLEKLQAFTQKVQTGPSFEVAKLAEAHALFNLKKFNEALAAYKDLEKSATLPIIKAHSSYNQGDVLTQARSFESANQAYEKAWKDYPQFREQFPNAYFNQAQNYFVQKDFRKSLSVFRDFLKKFPSHPEAPIVMTRAGEILEVLGAPQSRVVGAWLETQFRYGSTPLTLPARIRLLGQRFSALKERELAKVTGEILKEIAESELPGLQQMGAFVISEGYLKRNNFAESRNWLERFYKENLNTVDKNDLRRRIVRVIQEDLNNSVKLGQPVQALQTYEKYKDSYFKHVDRIDTQFLLANAYHVLGAEGEAESRLKKVLNRLYAIRGSSEEKERRVLERLPLISSVQLKLGKSFIQQNKKTEAYKVLSEIKNPEEMSQSEQVERVILFSHLMESRGESESAVRYLTELIREWRSEPVKVAEPYLELAKIERKMGRPDEAKRSLEMINTLKTSNPEVSDRVHFESLELVAQIEDDAKNFKEAAASYQKAVSLYPNRVSDRTRFRLGEVYLILGERNSAEAAWKPLESSKQPIWGKLAREKLSEKDWKQNYNKYIQRIPAAEAINKQEATE